MPIILPVTNRFLGVDMKKKKGFILIYAVIAMLLMLALSGALLTVAQYKINRAELSGKQFAERLEILTIGEEFIGTSGTVSDATKQKYQGKYLITVAPSAEGMSDEDAVVTLKVTKGTRDRLEIELTKQGSNFIVTKYYFVR